MITPDDKDWTWVLDEPCPECGFDAAAVAPGSVGASIRDNAATWLTVLGRDDVRERLSPQVWSPLEYACHVRDVDTLFATRLGLMLDEDDPVFANWDQDATAIADRYGEQDPSAVAEQLAAAAEGLAARFDTVTGDQWQRPGRRSNGSVFTVDSFARYLLHDLEHHVWDVTGRRADDVG